MALIVLNDAKLAFGHVDLLAGTQFSLESGERIGSAETAPASHPCSRF